MGGRTERGKGLLGREGDRLALTRPYLLAGEEQRRRPEQLEAVGGHRGGVEETVDDVDGQAERLEGVPQLAVHGDEPADQQAARLRGHLRGQKRDERAGPGRTGPHSPRSPHLRLPGKRLPRLEAALQRLVGAVPALPVLAEDLQLQAALRARRLLLQPPPPPPQERRAVPWPGAALQPLQGGSPPPVRLRHHGREPRAAAVSERQRCAAVFERWEAGSGQRQEIGLQNKTQNTVEEEPGRRSSSHLRTSSKRPGCA